MELPPRARRIPDDFRDLPGPDGTTSACAENTVYRGGDPYSSGNYLRVRGEYRGLEMLEKTPMELPPRARRIPTTWDNAEAQAGTTSACAENTVSGNFLGPGGRNYLRVRGEY